MKNRSKNHFFNLCIFCSLVPVLFIFIFFSHASAQHWTNYHQTVYCTVNVEQTFLGHWRVISLNFTAVNDSGTSIVYKCISCNDASAKCNEWGGFNCTITNNQRGQGIFSGRNSVVAIFYPGFATQQNSCEEVYQKADILLQYISDNLAICMRTGGTAFLESIPPFC